MPAQYPAFEPLAVSTWRRVGTTWFPVGPVPQPSPLAVLPLRFKTAEGRVTVNPVSPDPAIPADVGIITYFLALRIVFPGDKVEQGILDSRLMELKHKYPGIINESTQAGQQIFTIPLIDLGKVEDNAVDITPDVQDVSVAVPENSARQPRG